MAFSEVLTISFSDFRFSRFHSRLSLNHKETPTDLLVSRILHAVPLLEGNMFLFVERCPRVRCHLSTLEVGGWAIQCELNIAERAIYSKKSRHIDFVNVTYIPKRRPTYLKGIFIVKLLCSSWTVGSIQGLVDFTECLGNNLIYVNKATVEDRSKISSVWPDPI